MSFAGVSFGDVPFDGVPFDSVPFGDETFAGTSFGIGPFSETSFGGGATEDCAGFTRLLGDGGSTFTTGGDGAAFPAGGGVGFTTGGGGSAFTTGGGGAGSRAFARDIEGKCPIRIDAPIEIDLAKADGATVRPVMSHPVTITGRSSTTTRCPTIAP
jgi:hypothetical protein